MTRRAASLAPGIAAALCAPAGAALAQAAPAPAAAPDPVGGLLQVLLSLGFILAVIVGLAWLATRLRLTPRAASSALRVLADVPVGPKERVVLLKVGDSQALVGVGADGVRALRLLERQVELPADAGGPNAFAERLKSLMGGGTGANP
ncbi:MAG: flagellar biosynthetic protein FliO [Steroidobacteraceae bacterium]|nr:flagellar biosynthetic protein FliO [Steroidobacteraceae bacterium]